MICEVHTVLLEFYNITFWFNNFCTIVGIDVQLWRMSFENIRMKIYVSGNDDDSRYKHTAIFGIQLNKIYTLGNLFTRAEYN